MSTNHTFHIPVMGTAFSIDTPIKVAKYGISSVISLVDDTLIEEMRKYYCGVEGEKYEPITKHDEDYRARRITEYLNLVHRIVNKTFNDVKASCFEIGSEITKYFEMLPEDAPLKLLYNKMLSESDPSAKKQMQEDLRSQMKPGDINVNIMTKLDRTNYDSKKNELAQEYSDALAALRGYAQSTVSSAIVFSAGINRRLYSYVEKFKDFYADASGEIKKKIILKVSDYRSSIIQGQFFAKKGLWVSEYRVESGLNCGGHAFASDGFLMGPILEEFKRKKDELVGKLHKVYREAVTAKKLPFSDKPLGIKITAQGGIGTSRENSFLLQHYNIDGTGWATPFLLVPEATNVDLPTLDQLSSAQEKDLYLSEVSPLGVPFNNIKNNQSDAEKMRKADLGKPGSACPKGHLVSNTEFTEQPICSASRQYQKLKVEQLETLGLSEEAFKQKYNEIATKSCLCNDLGESALTINKISKNGVMPKRFTAICPGPNLAYFSKVASLADMVGHVYGRTNLLNDTYRPNMFVKELKMYVAYFIKEVKKIAIEPTEKQIKYFNDFKKNLFEGIDYYRELYPMMAEETHEYRMRALEEVQNYKNELVQFMQKHANIFPSPAEELLSV